MPLKNKKQKQKSADDTCYYFSKSMISKCEKILRIDGLWIIATLLFSGFIFLLEWSFVLISRIQVRYYGCGLIILNSTNRPRTDMLLLEKSQKTTNLI